MKHENIPGVAGRANNSSINRDIKNLSTIMR